MVKFLNWEIEMDTSRKGSASRATWREGKEAITHYFENFTGMIGYLGMVDFYTFREYWNFQKQRYNMIKGG